MLRLTLVDESGSVIDGWDIGDEGNDNLDADIFEALGKVVSSTRTVTRIREELGRIVYDR